MIVCDSAGARKLDAVWNDHDRYYTLSDEQQWPGVILKGGAVGLLQLSS